MPPLTGTGGTPMQTLWQDLRYVRMLQKNPGFTAVALLTLAMAICANAVVFSVLHALILHPLHLPHAESLYAIQHGNEASCYQSYADYLDLRDRNHSFDARAAYNADQAGLDSGENTTRLACGSKRELLRRIRPSALSRPAHSSLR